MAQTILHWLRRLKPAKLRLTLADGTARELERPAMERGIWAAWNRSVIAMRPTVIEALDAKSKIIGMRTLEDDGSEEEEPEAQTFPIDPSMQIPAASLVLISNLIAEAYDRASTQNREHHTELLGQMGGIVKLMTDRLNTMERAWQTLNMMHGDLLRKAATGGDGEEGDELAKFVIGQAANAMFGGAGFPGAPKANGANGASKPASSPASDASGEGGK